MDKKRVESLINSERYSYSISNRTEKTEIINKIQSQTGLSRSIISQRLNEPTKYSSRVAVKSNPNSQEVPIPKPFHTKLMGVTVTNDDGRNRQEIIEKDVYEGVELFLDREPDNPSDSNAIAVVTSVFEDKVGYLSREVAEEIAPFMDRGQLVTCQVANITGGGDKTLGVNVLITVYSIEESKAKYEEVISNLKNTSAPTITAKTKPTLKQRWLALPKKTRTWIIVILVILLIYFLGR